MKQKRYWLRGGLTLLGAYIVCVILSLNNIGLPTPIVFVLYEIHEPLIKVTNYCTGGESCGWMWVFILLIIGLIETFILGSLIGLIYGKIKNRKKQEN